MKKYLLLVMSFLIVGGLCHGQENENALNNNVIVTTGTINDNNKSVASKVDTIINVEGISIVRQKNIQIKKLRDTLAVCRDSLSILKDSLKAKVLEYDKLMEDIDFADKCMMALAYRRCTEAYNRQSVERALGYFDRLHKKETKEEYEGLRKALLDYEYCYGEIHGILDKAQNDPDRAGNPFAATEYKDKYIKMLKDSKYYRTYMDRKLEFTIEYLDGIVGEAIDLLSQHTSQNVADLSKLL